LRLFENKKQEARNKKQKQKRRQKKAKKKKIKPGKLENKKVMGLQGAILIFVFF